VIRDKLPDHDFSDSPRDDWRELSWLEKLFFAKLAKIGLRQDSLSAIFADCETFCIPQISTAFDQKGLFQ